MAGSDSKSPRVHALVPGAPFLAHLARAVLHHGFPGRAPGGDAETALAATTILVPTRRAVRALIEAFLDESGGEGCLLPRIRPIGDVDEDEMALASGPWPEAEAAGEDIAPAIGGVERQLLLARGILHWSRETGVFAGTGLDPSPAQAALLARELARLIDAADTEQVALSGIANLAADAFAANWQITLEFMKIVTEWLPDELARRGELAPMVRRNRLLQAESERLAAERPQAPIIAAGSTGSIPATAALLAVIARLPNGAVVLPGLDLDLDEEGWQAIGPDHPQYGLKQLLETIGVGREEVAPLPGAPAAAPARARLLSEAMRPSEATHLWRARTAALADAAAEGLEIVHAPGPHHEAVAIAAMMREALEQPGRTAALVTPDRGLARRVSLELGRWGIAVDDSGGTALSLTPPGVLLGLVAEAVADRLAPVPLLALLKHPLARLGLTAGELRARARALEIAALRGVRPAPGTDGLHEALRSARRQHASPRAPAPLRRLAKADFARIADLIERLERALSPLEGLRGRGTPGPFGALLEAHIRSAEAIAAGTESNGAQALWAGEAGEALALTLAGLRESAEASADIAFADYPGYLAALIEGAVVRPAAPGHPRAAIWGALEARLMSADTVILGGLNEGTWPRPVHTSPWLNRPMQSELGLEPPERRLGLAAHDFVSGAAAPRAILTRSEKIAGSPAVASRWLQRLEAVLGGLGLDERTDRSAHWLGLVDALERAPQRKAIAPPAPAPPLAARPRRLSVTRIERLIRDPYALYASHILKLEPLEPLDAEMTPALRGQIVHAILHRFAERHPGALAGDAREALVEIAAGVFAEHMDRPAVRAFWWPRFLRFAEWYIGEEDARRARYGRRHVEIRGMTVLAAPGGPFELTAVADRIDVADDGTLAILDYKTGTVPSAKQVVRGFSPQLPLEAAIARAGGFESVDEGAVSELAYLRITGAEPAGEWRTVAAGGEAGALAEQALDGVARLIAAYDAPAQPYLPRTLVAFERDRLDYDHLARYGEWGVDRGSESGP